MFHPIYSSADYPSPTGGVSGLVGRVTGVFGDTLADLTFDKEYKDKRKQSSGVGRGTHIGQGLEGAAKVHVGSSWEGEDAVRREGGGERLWKRGPVRSGEG